MSFLGEDFKKATTRWLYPRVPQQGFWRSIGLAVLLFVLYQILGTIFAVIVFLFLPAGGMAGFREIGQNYMATHTVAMSDAQRSALVEATTISLFPAALIIAVLALYLSHFGLPGRKGHLPLEWPKIGFAGWVLIVIGFIFFVNLAFVVFASVLGIDTQTTGLVEKAITDLAKDPLYFALAMPSTIIGAPLVEEILFRGILFAGIARTKLGWPGAVILTAAIWAVAHAGAAPWVFVAMIFGMGLVLGLLLLRFGSLWVTIACHTAWNTIVTLGLYAVGNNQ